MKQNVVLVDKHNQQLGLMGKYEAHHNPGFLHRAISVLLYRKVDDRLELLLQQRSKQKPLWPLIWANSCCTHPMEGESNLDCAVRRLLEEMGIVITREDLKALYSFYYQADYDVEWSEHELDAVVFGRYEGEVVINPDEVADSRWVKWCELLDEMKAEPDKFSPWFHLIVTDERLLRCIEELV